MVGQRAQPGDRSSRRQRRHGFGPQDSCALGHCRDGSGRPQVQPQLHPGTGRKPGAHRGQNHARKPLERTGPEPGLCVAQPQAFGSSKPQRTHSTAALKVPNHNQLLQLVLARHPAEPALARAPEPLSAKAANAALRPAEKRENWVRYAGGPVKTPASFDGTATDRSGWVHYLGAAFTRSWSGDAASRSETQAWAQYPSLGRANAAQTEANADSLKWVQYPSVARAAAPATQPESRLDTSGWVRFVANRIYPQQQLAQLFD